MEKRGELSSAQIIGIVLAIGSFIIVLIFAAIFFQSKDAFGDEACKLSVLTRASVSAGGNLVPLKCATKKICITGKLFGKCKQFAGESNVQRVKINLNNQEESTNTIEKESANAMYDCWNLMGQGKLDVLTRDSVAGSALSWVGVNIKLKVSKPKCVVCSRVAIADDVSSSREGMNILNGVDINSYMANNAVPLSDLSYLQTFTDRNINSYARIDKVNKSITKFEDAKPSNQLAFVFMQIKTTLSPKDAAEGVALGAFVVGAGGLMTSPGRIIARVVIKVAGWPVLALATIGVAGTAGFAAYTAHKSQLVSAGYCGPYTDNENAKVGCSLVKGVNWDVKTVNDLCYGGIEGEL